MQKTLLCALIVSLGLVACQKPAEAPKQAEASSSQSAAETHHDHSAHQHEHTHDEAHHHGHDHAHHGHDHHHDEGDVFACDNGKNARIVIHDHDGEIEAHATIDDITYDLAQDASQKDTYTTQDGINDQPTQMTITDNKAIFTDKDQQTLLTCTHA